MKRFSSRFLINTFVVLALCIFTTTGLLAYIQVRNMLRTNFWVVHTYQVMGEIDKMQAQIHESLYSLERNYSPATSPKQDIEHVNTLLLSHANALKELTSDNPVQHDKIPLLIENLKIFHNLLIQAINNPQQLNELQTQISSNTDNLEVLLNSMNKEEELLLDNRQVAVQHDAHISNIIIISTMVFAELLILSCLLLLNYHLTQLERAQQDKWEAEARQRRMINSSSDLLSAIDKDMRLISFNTAFENKYKKITGKNLTVGESVERILKSHNQTQDLINGWKRGLEGQEFTMTMPLANEDIYYEITFNPIRDFKGEIIGVSSIMRNITARIKVDQLKNEFVSIVSHELRTPLTSIRGSLGLLLGGSLGTMNEKAERMLQIGLNNTERLIQLINDILDIEKIESGKMEFHFSIFKIDDLVEEAVTANQQYAEKFNIKLEYKNENTNILVSADYNRLMQVLANLISNAVKFSLPNGTVVVHVVQEADNMVRVCVNDHGQGIDEEFKSRIFQKFAQADSSSIRMKGGTGLGLSICKIIIEKHNGTINFTSEPGDTTFYFEIPMSQLTGNSKSLPEHTKAKVTPLQKNKSIDILYVEDDVDLSLVVMDVLKGEGHVVLARNNKEALAAMDKNHFDLVLLDLLLNDESSVKIIETIAKHKIPIIIFSAYELPENYVPYVASVLTKSKTTNQELLDTIRTVSKSIKKINYP